MSRTPATVRLSPLETYALAGLQRCWMPEWGTWSHQYHLDGRAQPNTSRRPSDLYYSLNVLLGLSALPSSSPHYCNSGALLHSLVRSAQDVAVRDGFWGMALWTAACLDVGPPASAAGRVRELGNEVSSLVAWRAQDLGLALSGACAQAHRDRAWMGCVRRLHQALVTQLQGPGPLFRDCARGPRRRVASFATQVYASLALYHYSELTGDEAALESANACVRRLIALQGERGEWPWFYAPDHDRVLDRYQVYSVHQHGMAPAILHHAAAHGVAGAREAMIKGFEWIFGDNEMGVSMLRSESSMILRSQTRRFPYDSRLARLVRAASATFTGRGGKPAGKRALALTSEMRSYEFGWLLWSFGGRNDFPQLTENAAFSTSVSFSTDDAAMQTAMHRRPWPPVLEIVAK